VSGSSRHTKPSLAGRPSGSARRSSVRQATVQPLPCTEAAEVGIERVDAMCPRVLRGKMCLQLGMAPRAGRGPAGEPPRLRIEHRAQHHAGDDRAQAVHAEQRERLVQIGRRQVGIARRAVGGAAGLAQHLGAERHVAGHTLRDGGQRAFVLPQHAHQFRNDGGGARQQFGGVACAAQHGFECGQGLRFGGRHRRTGVRAALQQPGGKGGVVEGVRVIGHRRLRGRRHPLAVRRHPMRQPHAATLAHQGHEADPPFTHDAFRFLRTADMTQSLRPIANCRTAKRRRRNAGRRHCIGASRPNL